MHLKSPRIIKTAVLALYVRDGSCDTWKTGIDNLGQNDPYLDLDWPWEVTDVDVKGDVGVTSEGELLTGKTVSVFLDVGLRHNGHLLSRDGSSCWGESVCDQPTGGDGAVRAKTYHYECIITLTSQALVGRYYHGQTSFNFFWADRAKFYLVITSDLYLIVKETCGKKPQTEESLVWCPWWPEQRAAFTQNYTNSQNDALQGGIRILGEGEIVG